MKEKVIIAGFGGQGILFMGKVLAISAMNEGKNVTFFPSYGAEMRGGTANCHVVVSDEEIGSPVVEHPTSLIVMNEPSFNRFKTTIDKDGILFVNSSLVDIETKKENILSINATYLADKLGNLKVSNIVMFGFYLKIKNIVKIETVKRVLSDIFKENDKLLEVNIKALLVGNK